jgi:hypothetical protein
LLLIHWYFFHLIWFVTMSGNFWRGLYKGLYFATSSGGKLISHKIKVQARYQFSHKIHGLISFYNLIILLFYTYIGFFITKRISVHFYQKLKYRCQEVKFMNEGWICNFCVRGHAFNSFCSCFQMLPHTQLRWEPN